MNCSSCGAPLKKYDEYCEYCGALTKYGETLEDMRLQKEIEELDKENARLDRELAELDELDDELDNDDIDELDDLDEPKEYEPPKIDLPPIIPPEPEPAPEPKKIIPESLPEMPIASMSFVFFMYIFTVGAYSASWFLSRCVPLRKLSAEKKISIFMLSELYLAAYFIFFAIPFNYSNVTAEFGVDPTLKGFFGIIFVIFILSRCLAGMVGKILRDYAAKHIGREEAEKEIASSGFCLLFFGAAYLQYTINKMVRMKILAPKI